ncbi:hypothetical protein QM012_003806 [Aureobasidium pullulans]|uniref:Uncharacterized protein n=1 Tax=Aureobasidium pullulans TaxID=5580 RepID=A0ABR0T9A8_AURPU
MSMYNVTGYVYNIPPYPTPQAPCTISEDDCQALYEKNSSLVYASYNPICNISSTSSSSLTYATDSAGHTCSQCYLRASSARLLYWPVRTIAGSGDICGSSIQTQGLPRTGDGPNTFVTDGVTITSPSVGIYLASVSRADRCYTTLASTIVVVPPSEVLSARGARALYDHQPFQYQDLNYKCQPANSSEYWIQDEPGDDCYQQVPAVAYFSGESAFDWDEYYPTAFGPPLTIGPDYRPYILPPASMTDWANSIFSTSGCQIQVNGVWDPPRALLPGSTVPTPVVAWETATSAITASTSSALPAEADHSQLAETSGTQTDYTATALPDDLGDAPTPSVIASGHTTIIMTSEIRTALSSVVGEQSASVETTPSGSMYSVQEPSVDATSSGVPTQSTIATAMSEDQSSSAVSPASGTFISQGSTPSEFVTSAAEVSRSLDSPRSTMQLPGSHSSELSSTHTSDPVTQTLSSSHPVTSSPATFQGQATGLKLPISLALLFPMIVLWL